MTASVAAPGTRGPDAQGHARRALARVRPLGGGGRPVRRRWSRAAGYGLTVTPILEHAGVFLRGIGEGSEVVGKEMYVFEDHDGQMMALRPEGTAPIARAFVQHHPRAPWKAWYVAPSFRSREPPAGPLPPAPPAGTEALGPADPDLDVEVISLGATFFSALGLREVTLQADSMGDDICMPGYSALPRRVPRRARAEALRRARQAPPSTNPLRVLDCKTADCRGATADAPLFLEALCEPCRGALRPGTAGSTRSGLVYPTTTASCGASTTTPARRSSSRRRRLDAAQNGVGGRRPLRRAGRAARRRPDPGIGFGIGIERVLLACDAEGVFSTAAAIAARPLHAYVIDTAGGETALVLTAELRRAGLRADRAFDGRSMKSQIKSADRSGALVALVVGPQERARARSACVLCAVTTSSGRCPGLPLWTS